MANDTSPKKVTLKAIAEELGVSFSTVSKSLNNNPAIKPETRKMVIQKANEMGYSPNLLARGLRTNSTRTIAVIFNDIENPVLTYIFKNISVTMAERGYTTLICDSQFNIDSEQFSVQSVLSRIPDFVLIAPATTNYQNVEMLLENTSNVILFDQKHSSMNCHSIDVDYAHGGYIAAKELLEHGHREILIITEPLDYPYSVYYVNGIKKAFEEYRLPFREEYLHFAHSSLESTHSIILSLWDIEKKEFRLLFTAVMCFGDNFALGVYKAARQLGLSIPDDISVIGFDDNDICEFAYPALTSVHLPRKRMAQSCLEILISASDGDNRSKYNFSLSPHLVSRQSVKHL